MLLIILLIFLLVGWITADSHEKTQFVRLLDVFVYGPILIYIALDSSNNLNNIFKIILIIMGATTISYNAKNFLKIK